jgi:hypothetical protein
MLAGHERHYKSRGYFDLGKWKARVNRFRGVDFYSYVRDGTIIGHYLIDEPYDAHNWRRPISKGIRMSIRDRVHHLVDDLNDTELEAAEQMLQRLKEDPVSYALETAPVDDEPESEAEARLVAEARKEMEREGRISHSEIKRELGLRSGGSIGPYEL